MLFWVLSVINLLLALGSLLTMAPWWNGSADSLIVPTSIPFWLLSALLTYMVLYKLPPVTSFRFAVIAALVLATLLILMNVHLQYEAWHEAVSIVMREENGFHPNWFRPALFHYSGFLAGVFVLLIDKKIGMPWPKD